MQAYRLALAAVAITSGGIVSKPKFSPAVQKARYKKKKKKKKDI
jgi:hypothetical protein